MSSTVNIGTGTAIGRTPYKCMFWLLWVAEQLPSPSEGRSISHTGLKEHSGAVDVLLIIHLRNRVKSKIRRKMQIVYFRQGLW